MAVSGPRLGRPSNRAPPFPFCRRSGSALAHQLHPVLGDDDLGRDTVRLHNDRGEARCPETDADRQRPGRACDRSLRYPGRQPSAFQPKSDVSKRWSPRPRPPPRHRHSPLPAHEPRAELPAALYHQFRPFSKGQHGGLMLAPSRAKLASPPRREACQDLVKRPAVCISRHSPTSSCGDPCASPAILVDIVPTGG